MSLSPLVLLLASTLVQAQSGTPVYGMALSGPVNFVAYSGVPASPLTVTLTSTGTAPVTGLTAGISTNADLWSITNNCPASLVPGESCTLLVRLSPPAGTTAVSLSTALTVLSSNAGNKDPVALSGQVLHPEVTANPASLSFNALAGTTSPGQTITFTATNGVASQITVRSSQATFVITQDGCTGLSLAPGQACTIGVAYAPPASPGGASHGAGLILQVAANLQASQNRVDIGNANLSGSSSGALALSVTKSGTGSGTVSSAPAGIDCGASCSAIFAADSVVTLTAAPGGSSSFAGWSGACTNTTGPCSVTMSTARSVAANFIATTSPLSVSISFTPGTIRAGGSAQLAVTVINPNATPTGTDFTVDLPPGLVNASTQYSATSFDAGPCPTDSSVTLVTGGSTIVWHSGNIGASGKSCTYYSDVKSDSVGNFTVSLPSNAITNVFGSSAAASASLTVLPALRSVTPSVGANGLMSPGTQSVTQGDTATFMLTPDAGYFATVSGTCGGTLSGNTFTTLPVTADCTVVASFTPGVKYVVTTTAESGPGSWTNALFDLNNNQCAAANKRIEFAIPAATDAGCNAATGVCVVQLEFFNGHNISCPNVVVDGYTQPGASPNTAADHTNNAQLKIEFAGNGGFSLVHNNITMRGIAFAGVSVDSFVGGANTNSGTVLAGNYFGWRADGLTPAGGSNAPRVSLRSSGSPRNTNARVGGSNPADRNLFTTNNAANFAAGVELQGATGALVEGNTFNLDRNGNAVAGVGLRDGLGSSEGGSSGTFRRNIVANTRESGFRCIGGSGLTLTENEIYNVNLSMQAHPRGIAMAPECNRGRAAPVITSVVEATTVALQGTLNSVAGESFRIEFFHNATADTANIGRGEQFVASVQVTTNAAGFASFATSLPAFVRNVSATATRISTGDTSAFSGAYATALPILTVSKGGSGTGAVSSAPAAIDCGAICSGAFPVGAVVVLTATPAAGSTFAGWSGACSNTSGTCTVTMDAARTVTANFNVIVLPLSVSISFSPATVPAGGSAQMIVTVVNPNGTNTGTQFTLNLPGGLVNKFASGSASEFQPGFACSTNTNVSAVVGGSSFGWSSATLGTAGQGCIYVSEVTAANAGTYTVSLPANGITNAFGLSNAASGSLTVLPPTYVVTPSAGANGALSPLAVQSVTQGNTATFTITPDAGYFATVGGTCGGTLSGNTFTTLPVTANCTVIASFSPGANFVVTNTAASGAGSFANALGTIYNAAANTCLAGVKRIQFNIPPATDPGCDAVTGICTITLPDQITIRCDGIVIDGYAQPGAKPNTRTDFSNDADIRIEFTTALATGSPGTITIGRGATHAFGSASASNITLRGLAFPRHALEIAAGNSGSVLFGGGGHVVAGNVFGWHANGTQASGAVSTGISLTGASLASVRIGGPDPADRNMITYRNAALCCEVGSVGIKALGVNGSSFEGNYFNLDRSGAPVSTNGMVGGISLSGSLASGTPASSNNVVRRNVLANINGGPVFTGTGNGNTVTESLMFGHPANLAGIGFFDIPSGGTNPQQAPLVNSVTVFGGEVVASGTVTANNGGMVRLEFFDNPEAFQGGRAATFVGSMVVNTDAGGQGVFTKSLAASVRHLAVTATRLSTGDTSLFSNYTASTVATSATLSVARTGVGSGTVSGGGINCGAACSISVPIGTSITLVATPDAGASFAGWSGDCTNGSGDCTLTMSGPRSVTAAFDLPGRTLTVQKTGLSSDFVVSNPNGLLCGATCIADFNTGTTVTLTAEPGPNRIFVGWGGACSGTGTCVVTMDVARTVTAQFDSPVRTLTVTKTGIGSDFVVSNPAGLVCEPTCTADFATGLTVTLTAEPGPARIFVGWGGACSGIGPCSVTMDAAKTVTALFDSPLRTLTVAKTGDSTDFVVSTPTGLTCGSTCSAGFATGATVTLSAEPGAGRTFVSWGGACSGSGVCSVVMDAAKTVTATFTAGTTTLTVRRAGGGTGTITSSPAGIVCGSVCTGTFPLGSQVTLTAEADANSAFASWFGACSGPGACVVTMNSPSEVTATIESTLKLLSVQSTGAGVGQVVSNPAGINCVGTCSASFPQGATVTLNHIAISGSVFAGWSGSCTGNGACVVTMDAAKTVLASFVPAPSILTVQKPGTGTGSVVSNPAGINCGAVCSASYAPGTMVTLTATPGAGSVFTGWSGHCSGQATCIVTMDAAKNVVANFGAQMVTVTPNFLNDFGSANIFSPATVAVGTRLEVVLMPSLGFGPVLGGTCIGTLTGNTWLSEPLVADCTLDISFVRNGLVVVAYQNPGGTITPSGNLVVQPGAPLSFTVTPDGPGFTFTVESDCGGTLTGNVYAIAAVTSDCSVSPVYTRTQFNVTPSLAGAGSVTPSSAQVVMTGQTAVFTVAAPAGDDRISVGGSCGGQLTGLAYTTAPITQDCTVEVYYGSGPFAFVADATLGSGGNPTTIDGSVFIADIRTGAVFRKVKVGKYPFGVAVSADAGRAYIGNRDGNNISVIDAGANYTVVDTIALPGAPHGLALSPDGRRLYAALGVAGSVAVIDTASGTVLATLGTGGNPMHVAIDSAGTRVYASNNQSASVSVIDTAALSVIATIPVGGQPRGLAVNPVAAELYVANSLNDTVSIISTATNAVVATAPTGDFPHSIVVSPDGSRAFITNESAGTVTQLATASRTTSIFAAGAAPNGIAIDPIARQVIIVNRNTQSLLATGINPSGLDSGTVIAGVGGFGNQSWAIGSFVGGGAPFYSATASGQLTYSGPDAFRFYGSNIQPTAARRFYRGEQATFNISLDDGNTVSVGGTCGGTLSGTVYTTAPMTADCTVVANFAFKQRTITPVATGGGSLSPSAPFQVRHGLGTSLSINRQPGFRVTMGGTCDGQFGFLDGGRWDILYVDADCTVTAAFTPISPTTLDVVKTGPSAEYTVTSVPAGILCGNDCTEEFPLNQVVTLTVAANTATPVARFAGWSNGCSGTGSCVVTMDAAKAVTANFDRPPVAIVNAPSTGQVGVAMTLDASGSSATGRIVEYRWTSVQRPAGSVSPAFPISTINTQLTFAPDRLGRYEIQLVVTDDRGNVSAPATAIFLVADTINPTAVLAASPTQVNAGTPVTLSGGNSFDGGGGRVISYRFSAITRPAGATAFAAPVVSATPSIAFTPDKGGLWQLGLVVTDDAGNQSAMAVISLPVVGLPVAVVSAPATGSLGVELLLNAGPSTAPGRVVQYTWSLVERPSGSVVPANLPLQTIDALFRFTPDKLGRYKLQLVVGDDNGNLSAPIVVTILVVDAAVPIAVLDALPAAPVVGGLVALSGSRSVDAGGGRVVRYTFSAISRPAGAVAFATDVVSATPSITFTPDKAGLWRIRLVVSDDSGNDSAPIEVVLNVALPPFELDGVSSRKTHGAEGNFDLPIKTGIPVTGAVNVEPRISQSGHRIVFTFNAPVSSFGAVTSTDHVGAPIGAASAAKNGSELVVTLTSIPDASRVRVRVAGVNGEVDAEVTVGFLLGDVSGSRLVDFADVSAVRGRSGQKAASGNFKFDITASGSINSTDVLVAKLRQGIRLP